MLFFTLALIMGLVAFYGLSLSQITRKALALWLDRFREVKEDFSETTIQEIGDTLLNSYIVYCNNKLYYSMFAYGSFLVNAFWTTQLAYTQPIWMVVIVAGTNYFLIQWVISVHRDNAKQLKGIKAVINKYPQSFTKYE